MSKNKKIRTAQEGKWRNGKRVTEIPPAKKKVQNSTADAASILQRNCDKCRKEKPFLQRAQASVPPVVHDVLHSTGSPLNAATRGYMELALRQDFTQVKVI